MVLETAKDVLKAMEDRGFHLRRGEGRDDALYEQLKSELGCPVGTFLPRFLDDASISATDLIIAFLRIAEPFSLMYRDIYAVMKQHGAKKGSESIRIHCGADETALDIDIEDFVEWERVQTEVRCQLKQRLWPMDSFRAVSGILRKLGAYPNWNTGSRYEPDQPYSVPLPSPSGLNRIDNMIHTIYILLVGTAGAIYQANVKTSNSFVEALTEAGGATESDEMNRLLKNASFTREAFPCLLQQYEDLVERFQSGDWRKEDVDEAVDEFNEVISKLDVVKKDAEVLVDLFRKILDLPFWKYRWYLYEVWIATIVIDALREYEPEIPLNADEILPLVRGSAAVIGEFCDRDGNSLSIIAQHQTPVSGFANRKGMCPDYRIAQGGGKQPEDTLLVVECKQRKGMSASDLEKNISLYEYGAQRSIRNVFTNYDQFPPISLTSTKTTLVSHCHPGNAQQVAFLKTTVVDSLYNHGILPSRQGFDAILVDISWSMQNDYDDEQTHQSLLRLVQQNPRAKLFYFNDTLLDPGTIPAAELVSSIRLAIRGGTCLPRALESIRDRYPDVKRIALLTDVDYDEIDPNINTFFELVSCLPADMADKAELWR